MNDDSNQPDAAKDNNGKTVYSPKAPGQVEKVNPNTGGSAGTESTHDATKKPADR